ncbi:flagellar motor switch phosphatase FliY [Enterococcus sp. N249-2]
MSESLTQAEIDALLSQSAPTQPAGLEEQVKVDIIGEVGNISMSQAATTLSSILDRRVSITTPRVAKIKFGEVLQDLTAPKVATTVEFKEGLLGSNLMLLEVKDAIVIADLMMGGTGETANTQFTELELSAVAEAMNQMIGTASTSMATMISRKVDILPPIVKLWETPANIEYAAIDAEEEIYCISFSLRVEGLIESEIMQIFTDHVVNDIADAMLSDKATVVTRETPVEETPAAPVTPQAEPITEKTQVEVSKPAFQTLATKSVNEGDNLDLILDVPLDLSVILGRSKKSIKEILSFNTGSVIELDKLTDEPLEILLNGKLIATGEVVVINENFGVRITNILSQKQRIHNLH